MRVQDFKVEAAVQSMNVNMSDGRERIDGTWQDKMRIYEDQYLIGEIRAGHEKEDLKKVPRGEKCYVTYLPSQKLIRWAKSKTIKETLGGSRHDFVNRGDAKKESSPRRGYLTIASDGTVTIGT